MPALTHPRSNKSRVPGGLRIVVEVAFCCCARNYLHRAGPNSLETSSNQAVKPKRWGGSANTCSACFLTVPELPNMRRS
jgi:hypothetical protein